MVAGSDDFKQVVTGPGGVLSREDAAPAIIVDSSTVSADVSAQVRAAAEARMTQLLAAPVSGNPKVVAAGRLTVVASGPRISLRHGSAVSGAVRGGCHVRRGG